MAFFVCVFISLVALLGAAYAPMALKFMFEVWNGEESEEKR